ncbi:mitochondrial carnitine/acylcarnitine carrier protein [Folsomia candida]|uniref:mitochondrial carnitine/acylcarnitine carrier protein n=1 Tax=Folsomia candida TaxID=158441 RepID=UPI0016051E77|nr:mitochondrial carnitine/acylcarnitine carrier protein [Folsomia candida]
MTPAERIKCTLQIQAVGTTHRHHNNGTWDCIKHLWRTGGIRNLYKGLGITYVRGITQAGVYLGTSDTIIAMMTPSSGKMSPGRSMITGGMCGMLVWAAILPIDTVKTIIQTEKLELIDVRHQLTAYIFPCRPEFEDKFQEGGID